MADAKQPERKTYDLKPIETTLMQVATTQYQAMLSNIISLIAIERLAITVDENTRYEIGPDAKSFQVWQEPVPKPEVIGETK